MAKTPSSDLLRRMQRRARAIAKLSSDRAIEEHKARNPNPVKALTDAAMSLGVRPGDNGGLGEVRKLLKKFSGSGLKCPRCATYTVRTLPDGRSRCRDCGTYVDTKKGEPAP